MDNETHLLEMDKRLEEIETKMDKMANQVDKVFYALVGNDLSRDGGIFKRLEQAEVKLEQLEQFRNRFLWTATIFISIGGIVGSVVTIFINYYLSKH